MLTCSSSSIVLTGCGDDAVVDPTGSSDGSGGTTTGPGTTTAVDPTTSPTTGADSTGTTGSAMACGDGVLDPEEECDDANNDDDDGCSADCVVEEGYLCQGQPSECLSACGDGIVVGAEECDDDNNDAGDGCSATCSIEEGYECTGVPSTCATVCGDGEIAGLEECDDSNTDADDGCSDTCTAESGYQCMGEPSICATTCGDGLTAGDEECDDFNIVADDGCSPTCTVEPGWSCAMEPSMCTTGCGDGITAGMEECDDMGLVDGDGCSAMCTLETGWVCMGDPSVCDTDCGDGLIAGMEECDDGGLSTNDGCDDTCLLEPGFSCEGEPSLCDTVCGDGFVVGIENCDDGNRLQGDGCGMTCQPEFSWSCAGEPSVCNLVATLERVDLGIDTGCVLNSLGQLGCFGFNTEGEVGVGYQDVEVHLPLQALDNVVAFTSGQEHNCAIRVGGSAWCWGDNLGQQLGPNSMGTTDEWLPIEVPGMPPLVAIEAGDDHTSALDEMGAVWTWGENGNRQLGRGGATTTDDRFPAPVPMPGGLTAIALGNGDAHSCAILSDHTVACWGDDDNGQLGDGANGTDNGNAAVVPGLFAVIQVDGGSNHTCAITDLGELWCWGDNIDGQLGQGNTADSANPQLVPLPAAAEDVGLGDDFTCVLLVNDEIYCWGEGTDFQLGNGDLVDALVPNLVLDLPATDLVDIDVGGRGVCAMSATHQRYCWGYSDNGLLGNAPLTQIEPTPTLFAGPIQQLVPTRFEEPGILCAVTPAGTVECVGEGTTVSTSSTTGAAGIFEPLTYHLTYPTTLPLLADVQELGLGDGFACARTSTDVQCWGDNLNRNLGQGGTSTIDILTPVPVMGLGVVDELEVGDQFSCVRTGGTVQCWGDNDGYQSGVQGVTTDQSLPVTIMGLADAIDIELGENHACAIRAAGTVQCWGDDISGQLGDDDGNTNDSGIPVDVADLPVGVPVTDLALGQDHACAVAGGEVYCWGDALFGNLGQGNEADSDAAVQVPGLTGIVQIEAGLQFTCAIDGAGDAWCWGESRYGQLGDGGQMITGETEIRDPIPFAAGSGITDMVTGDGFVCIEQAGQWGCLGFTGTGQLGNGVSLEPPTPALVTTGL